MRRLRYEFDEMIQPGQIWTAGHVKVNVNEYGVIRMVEINWTNYDDDNPGWIEFGVQPTFGSDPWR